MDDLVKVLSQPVLVEADAMREIRKSDITNAVFNYLDTGTRPLTATEFFRFWWALSWDEQCELVKKVM
jgi:hypothetical protein